MRLLGQTGLALAMLAAGMPGAAVASRRPPPGLSAPRSSWRAVATEEDRQRLRDWRTIWMAARANVGMDAGDPVLLDPDDGQGGDIPAGDYRCRRVVLGDGVVAAGAWGRCAVVERGAVMEFAGPAAGASRLLGRIYPDTPRRSVFLGSVQFADERAPPPHGRAAGRDLAGVVERIGEARWRIALPNAPFGGLMQIVELGG